MTLPHRPNLTIAQGILLSTLVLLSASGLVASDINLPGMPLAARALDAPIAALQQTFSVFVIGLAVAQGLYGALPDTYGRRRLVIGGMVVYVLASIACALAPGVMTFGLARIFQALGPSGVRGMRGRIRMRGVSTMPAPGAAGGGRGCRNLPGTLSRHHRRIV